MAKSLRIMVPPHPLIAHWLTMLRNKETPPALFATGLEELGKWLCYEAIRDWLPYRKEKVETSNEITDGQIIEYNVPLLALPIEAGGYELWEGARRVLPNAHLCLNGVPESIESNAGVIILIDQIANGENLLKTLHSLNKQNVNAERIRIISAIASGPGLTKIGKDFENLNIYTSCIDQDLNDQGNICPGIGNPSQRLNTRIAGTN